MDGVPGQNNRQAVAAAIRFFKVKPEELLVIHDEGDLAIGRCKISFGRGAAGHQGVGSVIKSLGTKNFTRFRIGIRRDDRKTASFVLRKITNLDQATLHSAVTAFIEILTENRKP